MYTYIIIDDERLIRLGLISKINEISSEKFECVGEAENGQKGMELLEEITPDIIITDMKMAKMDGVEFLKKLHEKHSDIPVIVISGYKAFDYMSQAIEHGVVGYVLKPFSTEEIEKQLLKAVSRIEQKNNITKMREKISDLEQNREDMEFIKVITEPWNEEEELRQGLCMDNWHVLINIYTNVSEEMNILRECTKRFWSDCDYICFENKAVYGQYFVLFTVKEEQQAGTIISQVPEFFSAMKIRNHSGKFYGAVSGKIQGISQVHRAYQENEKMLRDIRLVDKVKFFYESEYSSQKRKLYTDDEIQDLMVAFKYETEGSHKAMKQFFTRFSIEKDTLREIGASCKRLLARIDEWAVENQVETDDIMSVFYTRYRFCDDLTKMEKEISGYANLISLSIQRKSYSDDYTYEQMCKYIQENYYKKITLQTLADQFYLSATQCSNILKKYMEKGLNVYLMEIRINKAKDLLDKTSMSVEQISREVGYPNPKYFFRMFKQATTFAPIEYRRRGDQE